MREGNIPVDWFARQVAQADRTDGDIDTLSNRIAHVRTWTFVANRPDWLADPEHWQGVTRAVEDKLSDALHERLAERFVDRRTSVLMRRLRENTMLETEIGKTGEVTVEGHVIGRLDGFMFAPDASAAGSEAKALNAAAQKALAGEIEARATKLSQASNDQIVLATDGALRWTGRSGRQAHRRRRHVASAPAHHRRRASHRPGARHGADAARSLAQDPYREAAGAAVLADRRRRRHRHGARRRVPAGRSARRAGAAEGGRGGQGPRSAGARHVAQIRRALRRLSHLSARRCSSRRRARWRRSSGRSSTRARTPRASAICCISRRAGAPRSRSTRTRRSRSTAPPVIASAASARCASISWSGWPISSGRRCPGAKASPGAEAGRRVRRPRLHRHRRHDLADRRVGRGLRLDPALARLSHGPQAETGGGVRPAERRRQARACCGGVFSAGRNARRRETDVARVVACRCCRMPNSMPQAGEPAGRAAAADGMRRPKRRRLKTTPAVPPTRRQQRRPTPPRKKPAFIEVWRPAGRADRRPHRPAPSAAARAQASRGACRHAGKPHREAAPAPSEAAAAAPEAGEPTRAGSPGSRAAATAPQRQERRERQQAAERQGPARRAQGPAGATAGPGRAATRATQVDRAEREQYYAKPFGARRRRNKEPDPNSPFAKLAALKQQLEQSAKSLER